MALQKLREDTGLKTYCVVIHAERKISRFSLFFASKLPFSDSDEVWSVWKKGYLRAEGKAKKAEEHGSVDKMSPSLKLPKQRGEGSQLPRKQL